MNSLISFDGFADVANNLIDKLSEAMGWIATHSTPNREAINTYIKEVQESNYDPLTKAALISHAKKTIREYSNQCNVVQNAMQHMLPSARPEEVDNDWMAQFMDKARLISDSEVQMIWGRILAEECNNPNSIPKGLLHILEQMDRKNATDFSQICAVSVRFVDEGGEVFCPIVVRGTHKEFYDKIGLTYDSLVDLASIGLIEQDTFLGSGVYTMGDLAQPAVIKYHDQKFELPEGVNKVNVGCVILTRQGQALCKALSPDKYDTFFEEICIPFFRGQVEKTEGKSI